MQYSSVSLKQTTDFIYILGPQFHTGHSRGRSRVEHQREYDDYADREIISERELLYPQEPPMQHVVGGPHHLEGGQDYRDRRMLDRGAPIMPHRSEHRSARDEDYHSPHRGTSRRALNAI